MSQPKGYSALQIALHWGVAALILFQLILGDDMSHAWRDFSKTGVAAMSLSVWAHIVVGVAILAFVLWRLVLRFTRGVPADPVGTTAKMALVAHWGHIGLYGLMLAVPLTGLIGWYGNQSLLVEAHGWLKPVLIVVILGHIAAALNHQFILKDGLLLRMKRPQD